jgi:flagellar motor switch/type III secretory pathway protein FliN
MTYVKKGAQHNAITHGIFAGIFLGSSGSAEAEEFHKLLAVATQTIHPRNGLEEVFVQKLAVLLLRLRRVYKADFDIALKLLARVEDSLSAKSNSFDLGLNDKETKSSPTVDTLLRYETTISREIGRTLTQIQQLRQMTEIDIEPIAPNPKAPDSESSVVLQDPEANP